MHSYCHVSPHRSGSGSTRRYIDIHRTEQGSCKKALTGSIKWAGNVHCFDLICLYLGCTVGGYCSCLTASRSTSTHVRFLKVSPEYSKAQKRRWTLFSQCELFWVFFSLSLLLSRQSVMFEKVFNLITASVTMGTEAKQEDFIYQAAGTLLPT